MSQDILSDVLRTVRLRSTLYYYVCCMGSWAAEAPPSEQVTSTVMPEVDQVISYHVVIAGDCWAAVVGEPPLRLRRGDIVLLPHGDAHVVSSAPGLRAVRQAQPSGAQRPFWLRYDEDGITQVALEDAGTDTPGATSLVCGFMGCDLRPFNPLIATLPRLLHLPADSGEGWGEQFARLAAAESRDRRPGSEALLERLSEMMFVDAIRRHVARLPPEATGWLAGLRDRQVGRALALLHEAPGEAWRIDTLGHRVGLSRSALHERFLDLLGIAPMQYLARWRMQIAARLLRESPQSVLAVAMQVGYESEAAFSRAFKRVVGQSPTAWRRDCNTAASQTETAA
jgi:AraC-like DNA-binding protein